LLQEPVRVDGHGTCIPGIENHISALVSEPDRLKLRPRRKADRVPPETVVPPSLGKEMWGFGSPGIGTRGRLPRWGKEASWNNETGWSRYGVLIRSCASSVFFVSSASFASELEVRSLKRESGQGPRPGRV